MTALTNQLPALQIVVPLFAALACALLRTGPAAWRLSLVVNWTCAGIAIGLLRHVLSHGPISYHLGNWAPPIGIEYRIDLLNAIVLVLVSGIGAVLIPFARRSVADEIPARRQAWFYSMYLLCYTGLLGITITGDAFNLFVFLEISSLSTYILIALGRNRNALLAAYQYLVMGTIGATFYVIGVGLLYLVTGSLNIVDIAARLGAAAIASPQPVIAALAFITVGIGLKLALFPLHVWLPNAYAYAPSVVSAFIAATATKVAIYVLIRLYFSVFGAAIDFQALPISEVMMVLSVLAMIVASIIAIVQEDLKRMLAYSSLAQIGYITLGISLANQEGLTGSIVHLLNHAMMKSALFLAAGAVVYRVGAARLSNLAGIGARMPVTMSAFVVAGLAMIGVPGTSGFISKWYLALGALEKGAWPLVVMIFISSVLALVYVGRVVEAAWFRPATGATITATDPPLSMLAPTLVLAGACIWFGLDTDFTAGFASAAAAQLLGAPQ